MKAASNEFLLLYSYDYKIELTTKNNLIKTLLWNQTIEELKTIKKYLIENLSKGFILILQEPFGVPIIFIKKPNSRLWFCIDFRKLNTITKKD